MTFGGIPKRNRIVLVPKKEKGPSRRFEIVLFGMIYLKRTVMQGSPVVVQSAVSGASERPSLDMREGSVTSTHSVPICTKERPGSVWAS